MICYSIKQKPREIILIDGRTILAGLPISSLPVDLVALLEKDTGRQTHKEMLLGQLPS
tara:strand:+ start:2719 stop:2892 length:174 start_codon:yes stop_codon:yes gene_type:complete